MQCIGNYKLEAVIGQGGNGIVYRSTHPVLKRPVAIKALHAELANDPEVRERFLHEARVTLDLNHPGIVNVYDVDQDGQRVFLVMEYFAHGNLAAALAQRRPALAQALELTAQVADALAFAHCRGVVHGDVKPSNILLRDDGSPVVADFGLAADQLAPGLGAPHGGQVRGTPAYIAPEQIRGQPATSRSDLYALGVVLYVLVSGRVPFSGTLEQLLQRQLTEQPAALRERVPSVPAALDALVGRLLAKQPGRRPSDMDQVEARLRAIGVTLPDAEATAGVQGAGEPHPPEQPHTLSGPESEHQSIHSDTLTVPIGPAGEPARPREPQEPPVVSL